MKGIRLLMVASLLFAGAAGKDAIAATPRPELDNKVASTVATFNGLSPAHIKLAGNAAGILVFPEVTKAGAGVAGEHGEGVLQIDGKTVDYYAVSSGSIGLTLGIARHSQMILFMTPRSLEQFTASSGWSVGADAEVMVVEAGARGEYDSMIDTKPILAFVFGEKGLIGDLSLVGTKISKLE